MAILPQNQQLIGPQDLNKAKQKKTGSGFVNIQNLLNPMAAQKVGSAVAGSILGQKDIKQQEAQSAIGGFQAQAEAAKLSDEQKRKLSGLVDKASSGNELTDEEVGQFQQAQAGTFGAKSELDQGDKTKIAQGMRSVEQMGRSAVDQGGRFNLVNQFLGTRGRGQRKLDELALSRSGQLGGIYGQTQGLVQASQEQIADAEKAAQNIKSGVESFGTELQTGISKKFGDIETGLKAKLNEAVQREGLVQNLNEAIKSGNTEGVVQLLNQLGMTEQANQLATASVNLQGLEQRGKFWPALQERLSYEGGKLQQLQNEYNDLKSIRTRPLNGSKYKDTEEAKQARLDRLATKKAELDRQASIVEELQKAQNMSTGLDTQESLLNQIKNSLSSYSSPFQSVLSSAARAGATDAELKAGLSVLASPEQRAAMRALSRLSGKESGYTLDSGAYAAPTIAPVNLVGTTQDELELLQLLNKYGIVGGTEEPAFPTDFNLGFSPTFST